MIRHMMELVITAWLGSHVVGVVQMGSITSRDDYCEKRGIAIVKILSKQQQRKDKHHRVRFGWDCHQSPMLGA